MRVSEFSFSRVVLIKVSCSVIDHYCDKRYKKTVEKLGPEARLYQGAGFFLRFSFTKIYNFSIFSFIAMVGGILLPAGTFLYAWTSYSYIHWIFPCLGISILYCGLYLIYLCVFSYIADSYTLYAASAIS